MTLREWISKNHKNYSSRADLVKAAADACGKSPQCARRVIRKMTDLFQSNRSTASGGIDLFRERFGKVEIERRRTSKLHDKIERFVATTLKAKKWMEDSEVRQILGLSSLDFSLIRKEFLSLTQEATDEDRRRVLLWVHPDFADEARAIINGQES